MTLYFGKYRGKVVSNQDPLGLGRLRVSVSSVLGLNDQVWAEPCLPFAGVDERGNVILLAAIPPRNAKVWVEFVGGDTSQPVWSGCYWDGNDHQKTDIRQAVLKTTAGTITLDDSQPGGSITIETTGGARIELNNNGIVLDNGRGATIELANNTVSVNSGALEVT
jgi:hypothetical protein